MEFLDLHFAVRGDPVKRFFAIGGAIVAALGGVGAGGLGQLLYVELSLFRHAEAATVIIAMLVLSVLVDWGSAWLRRRLAGY